MAKRSGATGTHVVKATLEGVRDGLARLSDIAPSTIDFYTEEEDWGLVGNDLADAMESMVIEHPKLKPPPSADDEELVEA